jgi:serine/threonine-protein kinase
VTAHLAPDVVVDGRYRLIAKIGSGGMADVWRAHDEELGRPVALKVLHPRFAADPQFVERFRREASHAAGLQHPNVVAVFDRGEWDGTPYIAMEYIEGPTLKEIVRERGALPPALAADVVVQILRAARYAHKHGIVHRDLKPHNVILDEEGRAKVTDFGIARAGASDMTLTGSIMGTAQYLSPEQAQGHAVSASSDLYAIGIVLYELLTGAVPFDGETAVTIALKQVSAVPPPPSSLNPAVPAELDAVVRRALAKEPAERFADAGEFLAALEYVRRTLVGDPNGVGPNGPVSAATAALLLPPLAEPPPIAPRDRRRWWWWAAAAALLLAAAAIALLLLLGPSKHQVTVPNVTGQPQAAASAQLVHAGLTPVPSSTPSTVVAAGLVIGESPPHGSVVDRGTRVTLSVSSGPGTAVLPEVKGLTEAKALDKLKKAGFKPTAQSQSSSTVPAGKVISTEPSAHTEAQAGSPVTLFVSSGPEQVQVPEVVGQSEAEAKASLRGAGLQPGTVTRREAPAAQAGTVLSQSPSGGSSVASGQRVDLVVGQAPKETAVPRVVGRREELAEGELVGAGFKPRTQKRTVSKPEEAGIVLQQTPAGGAKAKPGATVTIVVGQLGTTTTPSATTTTPSTTPSTTPAPPAGSATPTP